MPRKQAPDESEAIPLRIRSGFADQIVKEYVLAFRDSRRHEDGRPMPEDVVWGNLVDVLGIEGTTEWRY